MSPMLQSMLPNMTLAMQTGMTGMTRTKPIDNSNENYSTLAEIATSKGKPVLEFILSHSGLRPRIIG